MRILVAEDDEAIRYAMAKMLESLDADFRMVADGALVYQAAKDFNPDIVILDYSLPNRNAGEIIGELNEHMNHDSLIVVQSANTSAAVVEECLQLGAHDYLRKPFEMSELRLKLRNYIGTVEQAQALRRMHEEVEQERDILKRYFPKDFTEGLLSGKISAEIGGVVQEVTTMICDLRESTAMAEEIPADELAQFLSDLFADLADLVFGNRGMINSFRGDGFLATFGVPISSGEDAMNCARVALRIRSHLETVNSIRPPYLKKDLRIGIGIATGRVFVGNIGSVHRMDYTVLGDAVNLAARLESLTKQPGLDILLDGATRDILGERGIVRPARLGYVRGKRESVRIYHLDDLREE